MTTLLLSREDIEQALPEAVARIMLASAENPLQSIIDSTVKTRNGMTNTVGPLAQQAEQAWADAGKESIDFIELVLKNNPRKPLGQILARPDVQDALSYPYAQAGEKTKSLVQQAWDSGNAGGVSSAVKDLSKMGLKSGAITGGALYDDSILQSLLGDVDKNVSLIHDKLVTALVAGDVDKMAAIVKEFSWRNFLSVQEAGTFATNLAKEEALNKAALEQGISLKKMWVTRFGPGTCRVCALLHGTVRPLGEAFPDSEALKVYGDMLNHPPRHPNCRCIIVPWVNSTKGTPNPKTLKAFATKWLNGKV